MFAAIGATFVADEKDRHFKELIQETHDPGMLIQFKFFIRTDDPPVLLHINGSESNDSNSKELGCRCID